MTTWPSAGTPAREVISALGLQPLAAEGGWWRAGPRTAGLSSIRFLLTAEPDGFSAFHRLTVAEGWQWLAGAPATIVQLGDQPRAEAATATRVGLSPRDPQQVIEPGRWFAASTDGRWTLVSCWCAPAFTAETFSLGDRDDLRSRFPGDADLIERLTRPEIMPED